VLFDEGEFRIEAARNFDRESVINPAFKFSRSIAERVASTGASLLATDAQRDERFTDNMSVADLKLRSVACVPLKIHGEVFGVLYLDNRFQTGVFTPGDMAILESFGHQASIAIENARLHQDNLDRQEELRLSKEKVEELNRMLSKQVEEQKVELVRAKETLELNQKEFRSKYNYDNIVGTSKAMQTIFRLLDRITDSDVSVLIQGRSGTGKELVARAVHFNGPRRKMPFVSINCAAVSETLLESELFGHVRGAFTGAVRDKKGLFEFADKGTVFLDEISDMSHAMQTKLLRTLQEGEIRPVGGKNTKKVNVRILSASNKDLAQMVKDRHFREDLFYRLNVVRVNIPELQERNEDIPLLVEHFLTVLSAETQREKLSVSREAMHCLTIHDWPGNVRELENEMRRVNALSDGIVEVEDLSENIRCTKTPPKPEMDIDRPLKEITRQAVEEIESEVIARALARTGWKKTQTARLLGISRPTLDAKIGQSKLRREDA
jgi:transcriptional regulator with GAF, ATPase, and Fis domain